MQSNIDWTQVAVDAATTAASAAYSRSTEPKKLVVDVLAGAAPALAQNWLGQQGMVADADKKYYGAASVAAKTAIEMFIRAMSGAPKVAPVRIGARQVINSLAVKQVRKMELPFKTPFKDDFIHRESRSREHLAAPVSGGAADNGGDAQVEDMSAASAPMKIPNSGFVSNHSW